MPNPTIQQKLNARFKDRRKAAIKRQRTVNKTKLKPLKAHKTDKGIIDYMEFKSERRRQR